MTTELRSYVGGNWRDGARLVEDINPANPSEAVAQVSMSNASLAVAAVEAAFSAKLHPPPILFSIGRSREEGWDKLDDSIMIKLMEEIAGLGN